MQEMQIRDRGLPGSQGGCRAVIAGDDWQVKAPLALTADPGQKPWAFCLLTIRSTTILRQRDRQLDAPAARLVLQRLLPR